MGKLAANCSLSLSPRAPGFFMPSATGFLLVDNVGLAFRVPKSFFMVCFLTELTVACPDTEIRGLKFLITSGVLGPTGSLAGRLFLLLNKALHVSQQSTQFLNKRLENQFKKEEEQTTTTPP